MVSPHRRLSPTAVVSSACLAWSPEAKVVVVRCLRAKVPRGPRLFVRCKLMQLGYFFFDSDERWSSQYQGACRITEGEAAGVAA